MKKILLVLAGAFAPIAFLFFIVLVACLLVLDFFGTSSTDGYVENNFAYAKDYKQVLNENISNGYVPLERILYFYLSQDNKTFSTIYNENINYSLKNMRPLSEVCTNPSYRFLAICSPQNFKYGQNSEYQTKIFAKPLDFSKTTITSFFMEQRIVFGSYNVHKAWDFASPSQSEVYAVCDGVIITSNYKYKENENDTSGGLGNHLTIACNSDYENYKVTYGHLYPSNNPLQIGQEVKKGQVVGSVGTTGYSTGNHLHYQVQDKNNKYVDGMSLIDFSDGVEKPDNDNPGYNPYPNKPVYGN